MDTNRHEALEIYATYVETITQNESKRMQVNTAYMGFAAALITVGATVENANLVVLSALGLLLSGIWVAKLLYYRSLARAKFEALENVEGQFSLHPFRDEWASFKKHSPIFTLTDIELVAVGLFGIFSVFVFCSSAFG